MSPATGVTMPARRLWLRFIYSSNVRQPEDLWIHPTGEAQFFRVSYKLRVRSRPGPKDIMKNVPIERSGTFLTVEPPSLPGFIETTVERWLARNLD
jgi:hypothetical protein